MKKGILLGLAAVAALLFASCNDELDVQRSYDFSLSSWHLQNSAAYGEEIEIRFYLNREGDWDQAQYKIGYIQIEGKGEVYDTRRQRLVNREMQELSEVPGLDTDDPSRYVFTLYYRNLSDKRAEVRFVVTDNFGTERELAVKFSVEE